MFKMIGICQGFLVQTSSWGGVRVSQFQTQLQSSEAMFLTTYGRLSTTSDDEAQNLATPQTRREAQNAHRNLDRCVRSQEVKLLLVCLVLAFAVAMAVGNLQTINNPAHPEIFHQWLPWYFGPGLTPEALVWSAWTQAIILPLLGALSMASCILRMRGSKRLMMEIASLAVSVFIFGHFLACEVGPLRGLKEPPTEELQRNVIEFTWWGHLGLIVLTYYKLFVLEWSGAGISSLCMWGIWLVLRFSLKPGWAPWIGAAVAIGSWSCLILSTGLQAWALWAGAEEASQFREIRKNWAGQVDREVFFLRCAAVLSIWDSVYMPLAEHFIVPMIGYAWYLAFDAFSMFVTIQVLGYEAETLQDIGDMARLQGKRIAFPGKVNPEAKDCIVSFPGKYSQDPWHPLAILWFFPWFDAMDDAIEFSFQGVLQFECSSYPLTDVLAKSCKTFVTSVLLLGYFGWHRGRHWSCMWHDQHLWFQHRSVESSMTFIETLSGPWSNCNPS